MRRTVQLALFAALLGWLSGCDRGTTSPDTTISARDELDFSVWQREHLPALEATWRTDFPRALDRLRVDEAHRANVSHPADVEKLLLKRIHGSSIRDVLLESYRMKLYQLVMIQKLTEGWRAQGNSTLEDRADEPVETTALIDRIRRLDSRFDFAAFKAAVHVVIPPRSGIGERVSPGPGR